METNISYSKMVQTAERKQERELITKVHKALIYRFFSSSSFLKFSLAFFRSIDPLLGLRDLVIGDTEVLRLL